MAQTHVSDGSTLIPLTQQSASRKPLIIGALSFLFILSAVSLAVFRQNPPAAVPATAPPSDFSSARAMRQLEVIARRPHPMGSVEHAAVRDHLLQELKGLGLEPEVQKAEIIEQGRGTPFAAATVQNVVARLKGASNGKAVLLMGHYDSVPTSFGASDNGSAVAAILETLRALQAGSPLKNDVICLFTDGEEVGSIGARAFIGQHPWAKDVGLVMNFEARGNGGPSLLFETSNENGWLIDEIDKSSVAPASNSLLYEIYKALPNDTDLSPFKAAGFAGLNFAYVRGHAHYHSEADNIAQLDERSLQHQGAYALALARHFGNLDLETKRQQPSAVYFNPLGNSLILYSSATARLLTILVLVAFAGVLVVGLKRGRLTISGIVFGVFALLVTMAASLIAVSIVWFTVYSLHGGYRLISQGVPYNSNYYFISFVALTLAIGSALYIWYFKKETPQDLMAGALLWWALLLILSSMHFPGGSFLFAWPLLFGLGGLSFLLFAREQPTASATQLIVFCLYALPGLLLLTPTVHLLLEAMPIAVSGGVMLMVVLQLGLLIPHLKLITAGRKYLLPALSLSAAVVFLVIGSVTAGFSKDHPQPNNIFYSLNADTGKAIWGTTDERPDEWTSQFFPADAARGPLNDYLVAGGSNFLSSSAPVTELPSPEATVMQDSTANDIRTLRMMVVSRRQAPFLRMQIESQAKILGATLGGKPLAVLETNSDSGPQTPWGFFYYAPPVEGVELTINLKASEPLKIRVEDQSFELPEPHRANYKPRPDYMIPTPFPYNVYGDSTFVSKHFTF